MRKYHYPKMYSNYCPLLRSNYSLKVFGFVISGVPLMSLATLSTSEKNY